MKTEAYCAKHDRVVKIIPPAWAPFVIEWCAARELLTGCPCKDPDPVAFDTVWLPILDHLHAIDDEREGSRPISTDSRVVGGAPLAAWIDPDVFARILAGKPLSVLLDPSVGLGRDTPMTNRPNDDRQAQERELHRERAWLTWFLAHLALRTHQPGEVPALYPPHSGG